MSFGVKGLLIISIDVFADLKFRRHVFVHKGVKYKQKCISLKSYYSVILFQNT